MHHREATTGRSVRIGRRLGGPRHPRHDRQPRPRHDPEYEAQAHEDQPEADQELRPTASPRMTAANASAKAGTMNVTVLAAVAVVRRRTRKKTGQARAVDSTPTPIRDTTPSSSASRARR